MFATQVSKKKNTAAGVKPQRADLAGGKDSPAPNPVWQSLALNSTGIRRKLAVGQPDDPYEREADRIADQVMRMATTPASALQSPNPQSGNSKLPYAGVASRKVQRKCDHCDEEEEKLQRKEQSGNAEPSATAPPLVHEALNSPGQPLDPVTRSFMEERFDHDFGQVRVHTDTRAVASARGVNARAYTVGRDLVFNRGQYAPASEDGRRLLAHELTHVIQQNSPGPGPSLSVSAMQVQRQCEGDVGEPPAYPQCDLATTGFEDATARVTAGRKLARVQVSDALLVLDQLGQGTPSGEGASQFQAMFRTSPTPGRVGQVRHIFASICRWLLSSASRGGRNVLCRPAGGRNCPPNIGGFVSAVGGEVTSNRINLCPRGLSDAETTAKSIIHEAAHRFGVLPPPHVRERYERRAGFSPTLPAIETSADSFSAFAREAHGIMVSERHRDVDHGVEENHPTVLPGPGLEDLY